MKSVCKPICLAVLSFAVAVASNARSADDQTPPPEPPSIAGPWIGTLDVGVAKLRLVIRLSQGDDGAWKATLDSLDQGVKGIPVDTVSVETGALKFEIQGLLASYEGQLNNEGTEIAGKFTQGSTFPLSFTRMEKEPELNRPQTPQPPFPYDEHEVSYPSRQADVTIGGTLTIPRVSSPVPAVLLITGSGAQDRDETIFGHKPFHVLADYLARRGIAVLRVDDRGVGKSTGSMENSTTSDFVEDALGGVNYLKSRPEFAADKIGLAGHSEGGLIAPSVATRSSDVAFIVLMAGTGVSGEDILLRQTADILKASGVGEAQQAQQAAVLTKVIEIAKAKSDAEQIKAQMDKLLEETLAGLSEEERKNEATVAVVKALISPERLANAWMQYFVTYDPRPALAQVKCAVVAINGERDLQVAADVNLLEIHKALAAGGNHDYTIRVLAGLNHLFQTCTTGSPAEYGQIEETFAPAALAVIGDWIVQRTQAVAPTP